MSSMIISSSSSSSVNLSNGPSLESIGSRSNKSVILRPVPMKYPSEMKSAQEKSPPGGYSILSQFVSAIVSNRSASMSNNKKAMRVRLINSWHDVNFHSLNIVVCNYLYEKEDSFWSQLEKLSGQKREHLFYGFSLILFYFFMATSPIYTMYILIAVFIPMIRTMLAMSENDLNEMKNWLRYWAIFGAVLVSEYIMKRAFNVEKLDFLKLMFLGVAMLPYFSITQMVYEAIDSPFQMIREKFEQHNYHCVM